MKKIGHVTLAQYNRGKEPKRVINQSQIDISIVNKANLFTSLVQEEPPIPEEEPETQNAMLVKFYFNKFMVIDNACLYFTLQGLILSFIYYDSDTQSKTNQITQTILWLILMSTFLQICITVLRSRAMLDLRRQQCLEQPGVTVISRVYLKYIIAEIFILLIQPYPFLNQYHFKTMDELDGKTFNFKYNHLLCLFMMARIFIILRVLLRSSKYASPRGIRVRQIFGCQTGYQFVIKALLKDHPISLIGGVFLFQLFYFAWALKIAEGPLNISYISKNQDDPSSLSEYQNCIWCVIISMTTLGYGDFEPRSTIGRLLMSFIAIWGIFTGSLLIVVFQKILHMTNIELVTFNVLMNVLIKAKLRERAAFLITNMYKIRKETTLRQNNKYQSISQNEQQQSKQLFSHSKEFQIISRDLKLLRYQENIHEQFLMFIRLLRQDIKNIATNQLCLKQYIEKEFDMQKFTRREFKSN